MNSESQDALKRIHPGDVIVDSGVLLIADPAYIREEWQKGEPATEFYRRVGQVIDATRYGGLVSSKFNPYGLGVAGHIQSDGTYPVWGYLRPDGRGLEKIEVDLSTD